MSAQHTPGSWTLDPCASGWMLISNGQDITAEPFDARDADARLIAAAPDLLDVLQEAVKVLDYAAFALDAPEASHFRATIADARAAIAKATGGAA